MEYIAPIQKIESENKSINLFIKREDLLPLSFGGNKLRIAHEYFSDMDAKGKNCIIGYGNARSNLCRVLANLNSIRGGHCHIISPSDDNGLQVETSNSCLVKKCGATIHLCDKTHVAETVERVISECNDQGLQPYYINGNKYGKGNEAVPVRAYVKVYEEIQKQAAELGVKFDYIFLATGTGMTQAGLLAGQYEKNGKEDIIGISVARSAKDEVEVIANLLKAYFEDNHRMWDDKECIHVIDQYLCNGYGTYNDGIVNTVLKMYCQFGIPLDTTYTGKAFYGMLEYLKVNQIKNKNVLFIHTGGTPLFFDFIKEINEQKETILCRDVLKLNRFLEKIDDSLPVSLSSRVDLIEYARKVIENGKVLTIEEANEIVSAALFYCNDLEKRQAYLTLLGTLSNCEGKGYARFLVNEMEKIAKNEGMKSVHLDTENANTRAVAFYSKCGYRVDDVNIKIHMMKEL